MDRVKQGKIDQHRLFAELARLRESTESSVLRSSVESDETGIKQNGVFHFKACLKDDVATPPQTKSSQSNEDIPQFEASLRSPIVEEIK